MRYQATFFAVGFAAFLLVGCSPSPAPEGATNGAPSPVDGSKFLLATEPDNAREIIEARASAEKDKPIVVVGRIGGSVMPWIKDRAAFSIVDRSISSCLKTGDSCKTPWDYCCETDRLPTGMVLVKFLDESDKLIPTDARALLGVKELDTVVVEGAAKRDDAGNLTIVASGLYKRTDDVER